MEPHGVPSGGDWGLQRMGAIHLEGTKGVTIAECLVTRVDGNAIMLSGCKRNDITESRIWFSGGSQ